MTARLTSPFHSTSNLLAGFSPRSVVNIFTTYAKQVCVQLPTYTDNMALPTFTCCCCCCCSNWLVSPARWAHSSKPTACSSQVGQTDRRMPDSCIDTALHTAVCASKCCKRLLLYMYFTFILFNFHCLHTCNDWNKISAARGVVCANFLHVHVWIEGVAVLQCPFFLSTREEQFISIAAVIVWLFRIN